MEKYLSILEKYWGYTAFRSLQDEIIASVAKGKDTLGLMPTGGGKSITFQVPALSKEGVCLVITPLIALMKDQVENLRSKGIKAVSISSDMSRKEISIALDNCIFGDYKFLYISPERLSTEIFKRKIKEISSEYPNLKILLGAEADIIGLEGEIDICSEITKELDFLMVGLHPYVKPKNLSTAWNYVLGNQLVKINKGQQEKIKNINTKTLIETVNKHNCLAITHPGLKMEVDHKELAKACVKTDTALEINTSHRFPGVDIVLEIVNSGVNFIVNSDAHFPESVGELDFGSYVLEKAGVPPERVLNSVK